MATETMDLSIDEGTVVLVAEVLRAERGAAERDYKDAMQRITSAVLDLCEVTAEEDEDA